MFMGTFSQSENAAPSLPLQRKKPKQYNLCKKTLFFFFARTTDLAVAAAVDLVVV